MYKSLYIKHKILRLQKTVTDLRQANHSDLTIAKLRTCNITVYYTKVMQDRINYTRLKVLSSVPLTLYN